ncbi:MAG: PD-(D/E)XK nuclease family protein [Bacilli bacterium]|nr:PD-(D/E)XK nuclease family protein [Bacilli bacterium]
MNEVLIIKMFVGGFNDKNIGHEVINFYNPDNCEDKSYIYVPPLGKVAMDKYKGIEKIIMVGPPENYSYPILAIADVVEKFKDDNDRKLTEEQTSYGGKCVKNIAFAEDHQDDNAFVHLNFIVPHGKLKHPNCKICLVPAKNERFTVDKREECKQKIEKQGGKYILLDSENPQHSVAYCDISGENNKQLKGLLEDVKNWPEYPLKKVELTTALDGYDSNNFLAFIDKEYEEQVYTNMLYSIIKDGMTVQQRMDFSNFILDEVSKQLKTAFVENNEDLTVSKEKNSLTDIQSLILTCFSKKAGKKTKQEAATKLAKDYPTIVYDEKSVEIIEKQRGRVDLLLENQYHLIVVENKIKSALNGLYEDGDEIKTQLDKYENFARFYKEENESIRNAQTTVVVFTPNYNANIEFYGKQNCVAVITYSKLYQYFKGNPVNYKYFKEFLNALKLHICNREEEINRRFINVLKI